MGTAQDAINRIKAREKERAYLLAVLDLWAQAQAQGLGSDVVKGFGFDSRLLTPQQKREWQRTRRPGTPDPFIERLRNGGTRPRVYNYVRHHDGSVTVLDPILKAVYED